MQDIKFDFSKVEANFPAFIKAAVATAFAAGQAPAGGAAPGGMPSFASNKARIIIAKNLEREYLFHQSDTMIKEIINKINLH